MLVQSVELVALPGALAYQEKIYRARLDTGDTIDLFQSHWNVPLPPEVARKHRAERMLAVALHA